MDAEIKAEWIAALRSGRYQQGRTWLRQFSGEHCCLGVLCDLVAPHAWQRAEGGAWSHHGSVSLLPDAVAKPADLSTWVCSELMSMNDSGDSFALIANYIEQEL